MADYDSDLIIPEQVKTTIGRLIVVIAGEAEPARKIHYVSMLISEIRTGLKIIIRHWKLETVDSMLWDVIRAMILSETSDEGDYRKALVTISRLKAKFDPEISKDKNIKVKPMEKEIAAYMTLKDYYTVMGCRKRWHTANQTYFTNNDAWLHSNAMLSDIMDVLVDVATKHQMVIIPKNATFSIDEFNNYGAFKALPKEGQ
jgi:hypothetical protein